MMNVAELLIKSGMSSRATYYAGFSAKMKHYDNGKALIKMYNLLREEKGNYAAKSLEKLIAELPDLAASNFIAAIEHLSKNNWEYSSEILNSSPQIEITENQKLISLCVFAAKSENHPNETEAIKNAFKILQNSDPEDWPDNENDRDPATSQDPELLRKLADHWNLEIRESVAKNPWTPPDILNRFSCDSALGLRWMVADNYNAPASALNRLSTDECQYVRESIAANRNTPTITLKSLSRDRFFCVRRSVAENHLTPLSWLSLIKLWLNLPWFKLLESNHQNSKRTTARNLYIRNFFHYLAIAIQAFSIISSLALTLPILNFLDFHLRFYPDWIFFFIIPLVFLPLPSLTFYYCNFDPRSALD